MTFHHSEQGGGLAVAERPFPSGAPAVLDSFDDEFGLDVQVLVTLAPIGRNDCPTDDGCGNTCSGSDSSCSSSMNAL
ncbi:FxLD family lanthipeptide [Actinocorallia libanotica]|uniref:FxLD family lantipeptide n=1 Tax=Actinocorallia libanotica TaxID=46162 RepID=A0ABN1REW5_9ACTN